MPRITFQPSGRTVETPSGHDLLDVAKQAGLDIDIPCGGQGTCGRCATRVLSGHLDVSASPGSADIDLEEGYVLACRAKTGQEDATVEVREQAGFPESPLEGNGEAYAFTPEAWRERLPDGRPPIEITYTTVPPPQEGEGRSDLDRLNRTWRQGPESPVATGYTLNAMRQVAGALREKEGRIMLAAIRDGDSRRVIHAEAAGDGRPLYGIAVDLGTTTVAVGLVSLSEGRFIAARADYNGQVACGLDIISRINYARLPSRLEELRLKALKTINTLIDRVIKAAGSARDRIFCSVVSGNTTMVHLLLGMPPEYIRLAPYTPTVLDVPVLRAGDLGLDIHPEGAVYLSPAVGSYVGGDITAGILCTDFTEERDDLILFMDIGTNGEVVLGNRDFLLTCACSAGPAFEGGGIRNGMRAAAGAIDRVAIDPASGKAVYHTIGDVPPRGICGSGMISLLAGLFLGGWIDAAGRFKRPASSSLIDFKGRLGTYTIVPSEENAITIHEHDIEHLIRAKAAMYAACALMLKQAGIGFRDLSRIYIAGGFGRYLDIEDAVTIGLLPDVPRERFHYLGNASLKGSTLLLLSERHRLLQKRLARRMTYMELQTDPAYMDQYTGALFLPHTDGRQFPSAGKPRPIPAP